MEKLFYDIFDYSIPVPQFGGAFHITTLFIVLALTTLLCVFFRNCKSSTVKKILFVAWLAMALLETSKQIAMNTSFVDGHISWGYNWYIFPFQFCSSPLYVIPIILLAKEGRVQNAAIAFMTTFSLFAGAAVMFNVGDVFTWYLWVDIQTMTHHGLQIVLGIFLAVRYRDKLHIKQYLGAIVVFLGLVAMAMIINHVVSVTTHEYINMFFINPLHDTTLPILSRLYKGIPYIAFFAIYVLGFALAGFIVYMLEIGIKALILKLTQRNLVVVSEVTEDTILEELKETKTDKKPASTKKSTTKQTSAKTKKK